MAVRRGRDWKWSNLDHDNGKPGNGVITKCNETYYDYIGVKWENGHSYDYRAGAFPGGTGFAYDLLFAGTLFLKIGHTLLCTQRYL